MSKSVSPLAPKSFPALPAIDGRQNRDGGGRHPIQEPDRRSLRDPAQGHGGGRRFHALEMPLGPGRLVPQESRQGHGPRAGGEFRQRQCLHGKEGLGGRQAHRRHRRRSGRLPRLAGLHRLHRRDRRTARCDEVRKRASCLREEGKAHSLARCRQGDHDHRHLPESGDAHGDHRRRRGDDQRHRQGCRHDRARHGDDALLRLHGCAHRGPGAADTC